MEHPVRVAFCKILFGAMGGRFTLTGLPDFSDKEHVPLGNCDRAYDCGVCQLLQNWLAYLASQGWTWGWECDACLKATERSDRDAGLQRQVQGYYQAGRKRDLSPDDPNYDPDQPALEGCTRCGWESSFLQLVIRRGP